MPVLQIDLQIADLDTWLRDFASRAPAWQQAGITEVHVLQAEDDPQHIVELVFFDTADAANNYRTFLREQVWSSSSSPGLAGNPRALVLDGLETAEDAAATVLRSTPAAEQSARAIKEKKRIAAKLGRAIERRIAAKLTSATERRIAAKLTRAAERAPWRIEYRSAYTYELWNDSATPKFYVRITGEGVLHPKTVLRIDGHSSTSFHGLDATDGGTRVAVTWHRQEDQSDRPRRWTGNKPPKP